ncbi:hypothetical protein BN2476_690025 [Paraburkholderia piptadeniae]|uniref:Uncharacterized protein n=1 Tax=Paraburkholderia piptadeniae TaxID=1701573 RepID=A0A1N7SQH5_9BURK|nr:hypothetical protein BN2476_690025 [Paraburkholderia piptadeniae]
MSPWIRTADGTVPADWQTLARVSHKYIRPAVPGAKETNLHVPHLECDTRTHPATRSEVHPYA